MKSKQTLVFTGEAPFCMGTSGSTCPGDGGTGSGCRSQASAAASVGVVVGMVVGLVVMVVEARMGHVSPTSGMTGMVQVA